MNSMQKTYYINIDASNQLSVKGTETVIPAKGRAIGFLNQIYTILTSNPETRVVKSYELMQVINEIKSQCQNKSRLYYIMSWIPGSNANKVEKLSAQILKLVETEQNKSSVSVQEPNSLVKKAKDWKESDIKSFTKKKIESIDAIQFNSLEANVLQYFTRKQMSYLSDHQVAEINASTFSNLSKGVFQGIGDKVMVISPTNLMKILSTGKMDKYKDVSRKDKGLNILSIDQINMLTKDQAEQLSCSYGKNSNIFSVSDKNKNLAFKERLNCFNIEIPKALISSL